MKMIMLFYLGLTNKIQRIPDTSNPSRAFRLMVITAIQKLVCQHLGFLRPYFDFIFDCSYLDPIKVTAQID